MQEKGQKLFYIFLLFSMVVDFIPVKDK